MSSAPETIETAEIDPVVRAYLAGVDLTLVALGRAALPAGSTRLTQDLDLVCNLQGRLFGTFDNHAVPYRTPKAALTRPIHRTDRRQDSDGLDDGSASPRAPHGAADPLGKQRGSVEESLVMPRS